jgi:hypothetical protein
MFSSREAAALNAKHPKAHQAVKARAHGHGRISWCVWWIALMPLLGAGPAFAFLSTPGARAGAPLSRTCAQPCRKSSRSCRRSPCRRSSRRQGQRTSRCAVAGMAHREGEGGGAVGSVAAVAAVAAGRVHNTKEHHTTRRRPDCTYEEGGGGGRPD